MSTKKFIGWSAFSLFVAAVATLTLLVLSRSTGSPALNPQATLVVSGAFALGAAILGFYAYTTSPGKVGGIGGLVLFIAIAILLSFTTITRVEQSDAQPQSVIMEASTQ